MEQTPNVMDNNEESARENSFTGLTSWQYSPFYVPKDTGTQ